MGTPQVRVVRMIVDQGLGRQEKYKHFNARMSISGHKILGFIPTHPIRSIDGFASFKYVPMPVMVPQNAM